jgi:acetolactate synthase-1/2/3 large subunit
MLSNKTVTLPVETVGQAYLEILRARGIKYFFGNSGTDFGPIIDALAKLAADKKEFPKPITVAHEFVAVSMAQGYAMITGEPQVVMVHVIVGTGNASAAVMNASRLNVPMIFSAGRTPLTEEGLTGSRSNFIHWGQESFDQGSLLREFTRWDYELRNGQQVETVVDRALEMTLGTPQGPVYLTLPREVLAQKMDSITIHPYRKNRDEPLQPSAESIKRTVEILRGATNPLIITGRLGSDPTAVSAMVSFAEALVAPVVAPASPFVSMPNTHDYHLGVSSAPYIKMPMWSWSSKAMCPGIQLRASRRRMPRSFRSHATRTTAACRSAAFRKIFPSAAIPSSRSNCWRKNYEKDRALRKLFRSAPSTSAPGIRNIVRT